MNQMVEQNRYSLQEAFALREKPLKEIEAVQLISLKKHIRRAGTTAFYREAFDAIGLDEAELSSISDLTHLPFTTREDLDRFPEKFGVRDQKSIVDVALTSGTTGNAVMVPYTANDLQRLAFNEAVAFHSVGVRARDRVLLTVTLDRCFIAGLAYYSGVTMLGAAAIRNGPGQPARQWQIIETLRPRVVVGVPTFLYELACWGNEHGIDVSQSSIETIVTIGEPARRPGNILTPLGQNLHKLWGANLYSSYGATEFETAFGECSAQAGGHVHPELMLVEIVDDQGRVLPDGEQGEVVVTPLGVEGFPLLRLRTGDVARLDSTPCTCGWNTKRLGPVEGRLAQRLKYKGTTLYPETIFNVLQDDLRISGAYVEVRQSADGSDDITVVVGSDDSSLDVQFMVEQLQARLRVKPVIRVDSVAGVKAAMFADGSRKARKYFDFRNEE
ncbi:phenylacetate--CoA ligase family protein [Desulfosediminicola ganghwensis]|uniref:phenylacetate--CoA ligase family protein n=1 Tax=Desulfosediminicola ganghwensis TaxID=2569540 RepID=UPI001E30F9FB|nr:AMP-binding protein [Desulfosediminicola ganghwensis]